MFNHTTTALCIAAILGGATAGASAAPAPCGDAVVSCRGISAPVAQRTIDIALCLDTSGSMNGLIDAARRTMWDIVNEFACAQPAPRVRVALLTYGNNGHDPNAGWVHIDSQLTTNLDHVSQKLFALTTNGGDEYVGRVIDRAARCLSWSDDPNAMRLLVVAGNESADQDQQVRYVDACSTASGRDILINSIYCGNPDDSIATAWRAVATLGEGQYASINHNKTVPQIDTPYDKVLIELNAKLNATYVPYGREGRAHQMSQIAEDSNAASLGTANAASRAATKGTSVYTNTHWDLVDATAEPDFDFKSVDQSALPEKMQQMTIDGQMAFINEMRSQRADLKQQLTTNQTHRRAFIAEARAKISETDTFDQAILGTIRSQAIARGFTFTETPADKQP